jgi:hypothetical protein
MRRKDMNRPPVSVGRVDPAYGDNAFGRRLSRESGLFVSGLVIEPRKFSDSISNRVVLLQMASGEIPAEKTHRLRQIPDPKKGKQASYFTGDVP